MNELDVGASNSVVSHTALISFFGQENWMDPKHPVGCFHRGMINLLLAFGIVVLPTLVWGKRPLQERAPSLLPADGALVGRIGPLGPLQRRIRAFVSRYQQVGNLGATIKSERAYFRKRFGHDPLAPGSLKKFGLTPQTTLWVSALSMGAIEEYVGFLSPCQPKVVMATLRKASTGASVSRSTFKGQPITTLLGSEKIQVSARKLKRGYTGITYIPKGKGLLFFAWSSRPGTAKASAIRYAHIRIKELATKPARSLRQNKRFLAAMKRIRAGSSLFFFLNKGFINRTSGPGFRKLAKEWLKAAPSSPLRQALKKKSRAMLRWGLLELRIAARSLKARTYVAIDPKLREFQLLKQLTRVNTRPQTLFTRTGSGRDVLTLKGVLSLVGVYKNYRRFLTTTAKSNKDSQALLAQLKAFHKRSGLRLEQDVFGQMTGHTAIHITGLHPDTAVYMRTRRDLRDLGKTVEGVLVIEVKDTRRASEALKKLVKAWETSSKQRASRASVGATPVHRLRFKGKSYLYLAVLKGMLVASFQLKSIQMLQKRLRRGQGVAGIVRKGLKARHGGIAFLSLSPLRRDLGRLRLTYFQRLLMANVAQYAIGLKHLHIHVAIWPKGIGAEIGVKVD